MDLAALASAREAQQRAANAPANASGVSAIDVTEATFTAEVIDRSLTVPVIVELWTSRSGAGEDLSQALQRLVGEYAGRWVLARIDADAQPRLAAAFQVQAVPSVFAVLKGQPLPLFQGGLPEPQVRQFIDAVLAEAAKAGVTGTAGAEPQTPGDAAPVEPPVDPDLEAAFDAMERADWDAAGAAFSARLAKDPDDERAKAGMVTAALYCRASGVDPATVVASADAAPTDVARQLVAADAEASNQDFASAFARLIALVRVVSGDDRDAARARLLELFEVAGPDHPDVAKARIGLANALF